tara:strand:+ start:139 stop:354 length:216 start_codon:yes stop_codon:yes gene_type:complete
MTKKITDKNDPNYGVGMTNEELGYDGIPQVLKDGYVKLAKERGMKNAEAYYDYLKAKPSTFNISVKDILNR